MENIGTHNVIRMFSISGMQRTIKKGLTFAEVKEHIMNPESSSHSCKSAAGLMRTKKLGAWYDVNVWIPDPHCWGPA